MNFASDNTGPAHPQVLQAVLAANAGYALPYGEDPLSSQVRDQLRDLFEAPDAEVFLVPTGTAANALLLATLTDPWQEIYAAEHSHIREDECNAVEHATGGARITIVNPGDKLDPVALDDLMAKVAPHGPHNAQRGPVSITQVTDMGQIYSVDEVAAIGDVARRHGQPLHMDGARFANALVALGCSPAEMTWKAGVEALSFGATKNGCLGVEAAILFRPDRAWEFQLRRKRAGHLFSKGRYLAAQMQGYLADGLWLDSARRSNAAAARLAEGVRRVPGARLVAEPQANMIFVDLPAGAHRSALAAGAVYDLTSDPESVAADVPLRCRLVCDWSCDSASIDAFLDALAGGR